MKRKKTPWHEWLWLALALFLGLSLYNALFAWLALLFMALPIGFALVRGDKAFCNRYCPRGLLYHVLGSRLGLTLGRKPPAFFRAPWFRWLVVALFAVKFGFTLHGAFSATAENTPYAQRSLSPLADKPQAPDGTFLASPGSVHFAFAMADFMLGLTGVGVLLMLVFRPRTWCVVCPMGTLTQAMCRWRHPNR